MDVPPIRHVVILSGISGHLAELSSTFFSCEPVFMKYQIRKNSNHPQCKLSLPISKSFPTLRSHTLWRRAGRPTDLRTSRPPPPSALRTVLANPRADLPRCVFPGPIMYEARFIMHSYVTVLGERFTERWMRTSSRLAEPSRLHPPQISQHRLGQARR